MKTYIIVDLGYGDAGKGTTIDFLSRLTPNTLIVRYNGGPQAAHNVVTAEGVHHTFAQFGSGTLVPTVLTYLSKYMWIDPLSLLAENEGLKRKGVINALQRLSIDRDTPIITPFHKIANRIKERKTRHGSCGVGMGDAVVDYNEGLSLTVGSLSSPDAVHILKMIQEKKVEETKDVWDLVREDKELRDPNAPQLCYDLYRYLLDKITVIDGVNSWNSNRVDYSNFDQIIFEGACGILLDEKYGFHPHTMWANLTTENVSKLWSEEAITLGIIRTYSTRHGNGPFVSEETLPFIEPYNTTNEWQGSFRTGAFDLVATKYALKVNGGVDALVVTHTDEVYPKLCDAYTYYGGDINELAVPNNKEEQQKLTNNLFECKPHIVEFSVPFIEEISSRLELPVFIESFGAKSCDKRCMN